MTAMVLHQSYGGTLTLSVFIDQSFCHCVFIYVNVHWQLVSFLYDGPFYCFCLL